MFIDAVWSPAGKGIISCFSFVMSNCEVVTFPFVSWVRCGACLYRLYLSYSQDRSSLNINESRKICRMLQGTHQMLQGTHSAILSTFIKLQAVIKIFGLTIYE